MTKAIVNEFRNDIRGRNGRCTVSGTVNKKFPITLSDFETAHVFPVEEGAWVDNYFRGWTSINSLQNGLLMKGDIRISTIT